MSVEQERLTRIAKVADAAVLMDDAARTLFLEAICMGDRSLMADIQVAVESLQVTAPTEPEEAELEPVVNDLDDAATFETNDPPAISAEATSYQQELEEKPTELEPLLEESDQPSLDWLDDLWDKEGDLDVRVNSDVFSADDEQESRFEQAVATALEASDETEAATDPETEPDDPAYLETTVAYFRDSSDEPNPAEPTSYAQEPEPDSTEAGRETKVEESTRPAVDWLDDLWETDEDLDVRVHSDVFSRDDDADSRFEQAEAAAIEASDEAEIPADLGVFEGDGQLLDSIPEPEPDFGYSAELAEDIQSETETDEIPPEGIRLFTADALWDVDLAVDDSPSDKDSPAVDEDESVVAEVSLDFEDVTPDFSSEFVEDNETSMVSNVETEADVEIEATAVAILAEIEVDDNFDTADGEDVSEAVGDELNEDSLPTDPVGPYRLVEHLGRGRNNRVYVGERTDLDTDKQVAIKLFDPGHGPDSLDERFYFEGNAIASVEHPGVAEFLDANVSEAGQMYLVMELVRDTTIEHFADSRKLDERGRLKLFQKVCQIVHFGHQHLVIHGDLKPSNVRVSETGEVKLLDFGIARLIETDSESDPESASEYASPEQRSGEKLTTVSDVYSLGVLLQKLLTGKLSKSTRRGAQITGRSDLDAIIWKALREDPSVRYGSAEALYSDIQRYLDRVPVEAHPDSVGYRFGKLMSRHKVAFGAGVTAVVLLLSFAATMAMGLVGL